MNDQLRPPGWFLRPENWPYWMPSSMIGSVPLTSGPEMPSGSQPADLSLPKPLQSSRPMASPFAPNASDWGPENPPAQFVEHVPLDQAAHPVRQSARSEARSEKSVIARVLDAYLNPQADGVADLVTLLTREPAPMPKGLSTGNTGEILVNGKPVAETEEGLAWLEDQKARANWGPAMALMTALGRMPQTTGSGK